MSEQAGSFKKFAIFLEQLQQRIDMGLQEKDPEHFYTLSRELESVICELREKRVEIPPVEIKTFSFCDKCSTIFLGVFTVCPKCGEDMRLMGSDEAIKEGQYCQELIDFFEQEAPADFKMMLQSLAEKGFWIDTHTIGPKVKPSQQ